MDKETLSNYGWIVIAVLVLAVMIALATPFGQFIEAGVKSTAQGLFDVNQSAGAIAGLDIPDQEFEGSNGGSPSYDHNAPELNPTNTIPDGAIYANAATMTVYTEMPATVSEYDIYCYGDYAYIYSETNYGGWFVALATEDLGLCQIGFECTDRNQATYGAILESINGEPIKNMGDTFEGCTSLVTAPSIPSSVANMRDTFMNCTSLVTAPAIPSSVTNMTNTFKNCTSLVNPPNMNNATGVTDMTFTFDECTSLETAPDLSNCTQLTNMHCTFGGCTSLVTATVIPSSVTNMYNTFGGCTSLINPPNMSNATSVTNMESTFSDCTKLTTAPVIPSSVTDMDNTFARCTALVNPPDMSNATSVTSMYFTFGGCSALTGTISVPCQITTQSWYSCPITVEQYHYTGCGH